MTEDTQPGTNREVLPLVQTRARKGRELNDAAEAERLKTALFAALSRTGLNLKEIAERCGFKNANAFYNVRNGHSKMLSILTYITLSRHLNVPINELLGMPDRAVAKASVRDGASLQAATEQLARSFTFVRSATQQFYEQHIEPNAPGLDRMTKAKLVPGFLRIDCGIEAVAQDITALFNQLHEIVPELPPLPPL